MNINDFAYVDGHDITSYILFIKSHARPNVIKGETHDHHILPQWRYPEYSNLRENPWNRAILSHADHLIAHQLLAHNWPCLENKASIIILGSKKASDLEDFYRDLANHNSVIQRDKIAANDHIFLTDEFRKENSKMAKIRWDNNTHPFRPECMLSKYGVDNIMKLHEMVERTKINRTNTLLERYGVDHNWKIPEVIKTIMIKREETMLSRYGVAFNAQREEMRVHYRNLWMTHNPMFVPLHREKQKQTLRSRYGIENPMQDPDINARAVASRKLNERTKDAFTWYTNGENSIRVRKNSDEERQVIEDGYYLGRGNVFSNTMRTARTRIVNKAPHKEKYYKNDESKEVTRVRVGSIQEEFIIAHGFTAGRSIKNYKSLTLSDINDRINSR